jgi:hypothetical protein
MAEYPANQRSEMEPTHPSEILREDILPLPKSRRIEIRDAKLNARHQVVITSRLLGSDIGSPILVRAGNQLRQDFDDQRRATRALPENEKAKIAALGSRRGV